jgi:siroheme synthase-like protein
MKRPPHYPISLAVADRKCLVVGGGPVAARKVTGLLHCGAKVTVVAPRVVRTIVDQAASLDLSGSSGGGGRAGGGGSGGRGGAVAASGVASLTIERRSYRSPEAADYWLAVTATGVPAVDHAVFADADAGGVWVNSADDVENCTFLLPAVHRDGPVTVAVSTGGASPALAAWIRTQVATAIGPNVAVLAELLDEARRRLKASGRSTESVDWTAILDDRVVPLVRDGRIDEARSALRSLTEL